MSGYNILLGYGGGVNTSAGQVGFNDDTPGTNKTFTLPPFNTIKFEMWGGGGAGGGGDHNIAVNGGAGTQSDVFFNTLNGTTTVANPWDPITFSIGTVGDSRFYSPAPTNPTPTPTGYTYAYSGYKDGSVTFSKANGIVVTVSDWLADDNRKGSGGTYTLATPAQMFSGNTPIPGRYTNGNIASYSAGRDTSILGAEVFFDGVNLRINICWGVKGGAFSDTYAGGNIVNYLILPANLTTTTTYNNISIIAGGGGGGTGGNNNGTKTGTGGGGGSTSGSLPVGTLQLVNGKSGTNAVDGSPGYGGEAGNAPGTAGNPGSTGGAGGSPGGGGGGGGYDNGAAPGGGKKSGGGSVKDSAGGGGGGGGGYASASFVKGQIPQRATITYSVGDRGIAGPAEYPGGSGARGKFKITWT